MPTKQQITDKTVSAIASLDNDEYSLDQIRRDHSLKIHRHLGLGEDRRKICARILNRYIKQHNGPYLKLTDLVKATDSVKDVIAKVEQAIPKEGS